MDDFVEVEFVDLVFVVVKFWEIEVVVK